MPHTLQGVWGFFIMDISKGEKTIKELFVGNCWSYLHDNFHKFNETNKIKIALELCKKDQPTKVEGALNVTMMPEVKVDGKPLELNIGDRLVNLQELPIG